MKKIFTLHNRGNHWLRIGNKNSPDIKLRSFRFSKRKFAGFIFSFIVLGISSIIGQVVIIRELTISFYGNEFFIGWILFAWLFWVAMGSLFWNKAFKKIKNIPKVFVSCHILAALFLPLEIYLIRFSKTIMGGNPGEIPNLIPALLYAFLAIAPLSLILGLQFVIANRSWKKLFKKAEISYLIGKSYFYETIGFVVGGIIFSYFLIFINEFKVSTILAWLNLIAAGFILSLIKKRTILLKTIAIISFIVFIGGFLWSDNINFQTAKLRFPNQELVEYKNSIYGNTAVTALSGVTKTQYNFYESGLFLGLDKEKIFNEYLIHFPFLYHPNPKKILLIGNGFNGALIEILKYQPSNIYYLELDPQIIEMAKKYIPLEPRQSLEDKRVKIINVDGRYFIKNSQEKFDLAIINLPNPSTALINRFYSQEFLKEISSHLNPKGILALHLSSSPNYLSAELENIQASLYKTIKEIFPYLIILPEDTNFFIASQDKLDYDPQLLIQRLKERNIKNNFVTENYIKYRLTNDRVQKTLNLLEDNKKAEINQDSKPISYYYNLVYWISYFHSGLAKFLTFLSKINFLWIIGFFALLIILIIIKFWIRRPRMHSSQRLKLRAYQGLFPLAMAIAGFSLMASEILIIFAFQIFYGYLYYKIGLIIASLMAGMALGTWLALHWHRTKVKISSLIKIHGLIIIFCLIFLITSWILFKTSPRSSFLIEMIFLVLALLIGGIVGFEFPIINKLYLKQKPRHKKTGQARFAESKRAGIIYGADLFGSCLGAFLVGIFILPIFGIFQTLILLAILNVFILILLFNK